MSTPVKDPFDDLLDLGDGDSPPPLPTTQPPPESDSWMVLPDGGDDFKSVTDTDLFGSGTSSITNGGKKSTSHAHGSTFDDLFGEGSSDKKKKKSPSSHGATFDDLFGDDKSSKNFKNGSTTFEDLFPEECDPKPTVTSPTRKTSDIDDLLGMSSSKTSDTAESSKITGSALDDLFGTGGKSSLGNTSKKEESLEDIFGSPSGKATTTDTSSKKNDKFIDNLFGTPLEQTKTSDTAGKKSEESLDELFGSRIKVADSEPADKHEDKDTEDEFGQAEKSNSKLTAHGDGPTYDDLFGDEPPNKKSDDTTDDLFESSKQKTNKDSPIKKSEKSLDDLFGPSSSKGGMDDLFGTGTSSRSAEIKVTSMDMTQKTSSMSSDLDDLFSSSSSKPAADVSLETGRTDVNGMDTVDAKVDILISPVGDKKQAYESRRAKIDFKWLPPQSDIQKVKAHTSRASRLTNKMAADPYATRTSTSELGDQETPLDDLDFSVIEDTSLLDPNITRHKSSLRKRGSLARRKKPTRASMRRVHQQDEDPFSPSPSKPDEDKDDDEQEKAESPSTQPEKDDKKEEAPPPVKRSPVAGGKLLIGPDMLAQSQLMKGIASRKDRASAATKPSDDAVATATKSDKSDATHKPVIKPSKPQVSPRPSLGPKLSPTSDLKSNTEIQVKLRSQEPKPDTASVTPSTAKVTLDNKESEKNSAVSTVLKPTSTNVPQTSSKQIPSVTLEKVALRSTRSGSFPPEPKVTSPSAENKVIHSELAERKNSLRRVSPAKNKESDEPKEEKKSQPTWLTEMKLRSTSRNTPDNASSKVTESKSRSAVKDEVDNTTWSSNKPAITPRIRDVDSPRVSENKPMPARRPVIDRPKPKIEASKPLLSVNGKGDSPGRSPLGVKEINTSSTEVPSWKRELAERKKKRKEDPAQSTPTKSEAPPDVATNWRTQMSQKKRRPVPTPAGDAKASPDSKQPEWAIQAEQRRARLAKSGLLGQK